MLGGALQGLATPGRYLLSLAEEVSEEEMSEDEERETENHILVGKSLPGNSFPFPRLSLSALILLRRSCEYDCVRLLNRSPRHVGAQKP